MAHSNFGDSDVAELVCKAKGDFQDAWGDVGNVCYKWTHASWSKVGSLTRLSSTVKNLTGAVWTALEESAPSASSASSAGPSRKRITTKVDAKTAQAVFGAITTEPHDRMPYAADESAPAPPDQLRSIVDELIGTSWGDPRAPSDPLSTVDDWINRLDEKVASSSLSSWEQHDDKGRLTPQRKLGIYSIGLATLECGFKFEIRFKDNGKGKLMYHGCPPGVVLYIIELGFHPTTTVTLSSSLLKKFGVVPPLVWFSGIYDCAAGYPQSDWAGDIALGVPLGNLCVQLWEPFVLRNTRFSSPLPSITVQP